MKDFGGGSASAKKAKGRAWTGTAFHVCISKNKKNNMLKIECDFPTPVGDKQDLAATALAFTRFTSTAGPLTKTFTPQPDGTVKKEAAAQLWKGRAERVEVHNVEELRDVLEGLTDHQALGWGVPTGGRREVTIAPGKSVAGGAAPPGAVARTKQEFEWPDGPGGLILDHDTGRDGGPAMPSEKLIERLITAVPELAQAPMLVGRSASASVVWGRDGKPVGDANKTRIYIPVSSAKSIPALGALLFKRLWLQGDGWFDVSKSGSLLQRSLVDSAVWSPERLDFAGPVTVGEGLAIAPRDWQVLNGDAAPLAVGSVAELTPSEESRFHELVAAVREARKPQAQEKRLDWESSRASLITVKTGATFEEAQELVRSALGGHGDGVLLGGYLLRTASGAFVTVAEVLKDAQQYVGQYFYDPIESDDLDKPQAAWLDCRNGRPKLYSHAHGGRWYHLKLARIRLEVKGGDQVFVVDELVRAMREDGQFYNKPDGSLALVDGGETVGLDLYGAKYELGKLVAAYKIKTGGGRVPTDLKDEPIKVVLARGCRRDLPTLRGIITAPTLRPDGTVLDQPGYDAPTGLILHLDREDLPATPERPTEADLEQALCTLWGAFRGFAWANPQQDAAVMLAALLTAVARPVLPTAPAFGFDAAMAGAGKTLLAQCVGALAKGRAPAATPPATGGEEQRKRFLSTLLNDPASVIIWDNLTTDFGGSAIEAFLTAPEYTDRVLRASELGTVTNKAMLLLTGRNIRLKGDTNRRTLIARIDPGCAEPYARSFEFNPLHAVLADRLVLVAAALTVIRWGLADVEREPIGKELGSFEEWSRFVSRPVAAVGRWLEQDKDAAQRLAQAVGFPAGLSDPVEGIKRNYEQGDPHQALLQGLFQLLIDTSVNGRPLADGFGVADLQRKVQAERLGSPGALCEWWDEVLATVDGTGSESQKVGNWLRRNALDVPMGSFVLVQAGKRGGSQLYKVKGQD